MRKWLSVNSACILWAALFTGCGARETVSAPAVVVRAGGATTVVDATRDAFSLPAPNLTPEHRKTFFVGNSLFNQNWVSAPSSVPDRDGLGPLFNARSCSGCHFKDGRGRPPAANQGFVSMLLRVSIPGRDPHGGPLPHPFYGDQIQHLALTAIPAEAEPHVEFTEQPAAFPDGDRYSLRTPHYKLLQPGYGDPGSLLISARVAPQLIGLGLLEAVPDAFLRSTADPKDRDGDGISGRVNEVWDVKRGAMALGRFGWKAEQPSVRQQTAGAFVGDMGITSTLFTTENHSDAQTAALSAPSGGSPEVRDEGLNAVVLYARTLGVPARRDVDEPEVKRGEAFFTQLGCANCHTQTLVSGPKSDLPELRDQTFHPYTDLLLHDLGDALSDHRPSYAADGREWRTPPLWGIGLVQKVNGHTYFLHDGRARDLTEAILWHGGEATQARKRFVELPRAARRSVIAFLNSL